MSNDSQPSGNMPDLFDYTLGQLKDLPDVLMTKESTVRAVPLLGIGGSRLFIVQTIRQAERGDTILLEHVAQGQTVRLVLPPEVANVIARQRDALTARSRSKGAQKAVATRAERGIEPAFLKRRRKGAGK
jgi:hypothetical protein